MKKRVTICGESFGIGGAEKMTVDIANALHGKGHDVQVITVLGKDGIFRDQMVPEVPSFFYPDSKELLKHLVRNARPDVIIFNNCRAAHAIMPVIRKHFDGVKIIALVHGSESLSLNLIPAHFPFDKIVTVSQRAKDGIEERIPAWNGKVEIIEAVINTDKFSPGPSNVEIECWPNDARVFVYCGRISGEKNLITLADCFRRVKSELPSAKLLVVGGVDGSAGPILEKYWQDELDTFQGVVDQMGLTNDVLITGVVDDPWEFIRLGHTFCMTSMYEGTPLAMLEAMACGLPVVCPDVGNVPEVLDDSGAGFVVMRKEGQQMDEDERNLYASEMVRLSSNPAITKGNGRKYVQQRFGMERFADQWSGLVCDPENFKTENFVSTCGTVEILVDRRGHAFDRIAQRIKNAVLPEYKSDVKYVLIKDRIESGIIFWWRDWRLVKYPERSAVCVYDHESWTAEDAKSVLNKFKIVCTANNKLRRELVAACPELKTKIVSVDDGVDTEFFTPGNRAVNLQGKLRVGWVGSSKWAASCEEFADMKGFEIIKQAWNETKDICHWQIVDSSQVPIPFEQMPDYYRNIDVLVCMSQSEGTPNPALEAAASGCYVLTTNVGITGAAIRSGMIGKHIPRNVQSLVNELRLLDKKRGALENALKKSPKAMRESWDWSIRSKPWRNVVQQLNGKVYLRDEVTVFVSTIGAPDFPHCMKALENQDCEVDIKVIENVSPMSAAFNAMIDQCQTPYYVQVDEDMILRPNAVRMLYERIKWTGDRTAFYFLCLRDRFIEKTLVGVKIYRRDSIKLFPFQDEFSCEVSQMDRMKQSGYGIEGEFPGIDSDPNHEAVVGDLNCHWTPWTVFEKYTRDLQKFSSTEAGKKMLWMKDLPKWMAAKYKKDGTRESLFAMLGCAFGLAIPADHNEGEKDFTKPRFKSIFEELDKML